MSKLDERIQEVADLESEVDELERLRSNGRITVEQITQASIRLVFARERLWIEQEKTRLAGRKGEIV